MTPHHGGPDVVALVGVLLGLLAVGAYAGLLLRTRRAGRRWSPARAVAWFAGCALAVVAVVGPSGSAAMGGPSHMAGHLLLGMAGPLLLVLGTPVTVALRALPVRTGRRLVRVLRSRPLRLLTAPGVAAVLDVGGLWLLYATPLLGATHAHPLLDLAVHLHVLLAGYLLTAVLVGPDPLPHRRGTRHLLVVLVLALAAHDVLAKWLFAHAAGPLEEQGALVMYYGGDAVDLTLAVLVCARWYRRGRVPDATRAPARRRTSVPST